MEGESSSRSPDTAEGKSTTTHSNSHSHSHIDLLKDNFVTIEYENGNRLLPKIIISDEFYEKLCAPWRKTLIFKLLGKKKGKEKEIGYFLMKDKLKETWKIRAGFEMIDVGYGFYAITFDEDDDRDKVIGNGPWVIFNQLLTVRLWSPEFVSSENAVDRTLIWIRFPGLSFVFHDESVLFTLASCAGCPVKVDPNTLRITNGRFSGRVCVARVCVEIDLSLLLVENFCLQDHWYKIEYEGMDLLLPSVVVRPEEPRIELKSFEKVASGEGCSTSGSGSRDDGSVFRVYFKGLVSEEIVKGQKVVFGGIGVAVCDEDDNLLLEVSKPLLLGIETSRVIAEAKALIEALDAAHSLELKRIVYFCDYCTLLQFVSGKWPVKHQKVAMLVNEVHLLQREFTYCNPRLVSRDDLKYASKLARDAIVSQSTRHAESGSSTKSLNQTCVICLEDSDINQFFSVDGCQHRYCFSCMKRHVEVKLLHGMVPKCPHEGCNNELLADSCRKFLPHKLIETMQQRKLEASIPVTDKIYCPYPRCSALMSKTEVLEYSKNLTGSEPGRKRCIKCRRFFCFMCKVPWHFDMSCYRYKMLNPNPPAEDLKLKSLATSSFWRQCVKCNHMIELAEGCYHITCRCGNEFCYQCGAEWKDKKATCDCPLWADDDESEWEEDEDVDDDDDDSYTDSPDDFY
ncbi:uncharacterized protein LOC130745886 [Lotus japonicus]|uniref:uncharacterized protein LOC130745886 n=1 Tax=Lotus japonicus TaxID=34305 RepID=UPI00258512BD|nr:uncharacterized protein LOC130745886 [Lotus japonicus]